MKYADIIIAFLLAVAVLTPGSWWPEQRRDYAGLEVVSENLSYPVLLKKDRWEVVIP